MLANKIEQMQSCFDDQEVEECEVHSELELKVEVAKKINEHMPANELRTARRPENMAPRTFFLDRPLYLLRQLLNQPCRQQPTTMQQGRLKPSLTNTKNLGVQQYFNRKKYRCVYNKLESQRADCRTFLGKLKGIDVLIDYNWKFFKQLQPQVNVLEENREDRIDSDFQSGNLCRAYVHVEEEEREYSLLIENDVNTHGYNNWFFFRFRNRETGVRRLNVVNLAKKTNFYAQGMLVSILSVRSEAGWVKGGDRITFGSVNLLRDRQQLDCYSSLSFQYDFQHANDEVYFSLSQPYTYTRLINFISNIQEEHASQVQVKTIGYSIANNIIPVLKFGKNTPQQNDKPVFLVLARQHPCETVGSFIAEYLMKELLERSVVADWLQQQFEFIILPMVNPDGVIHGMSRCNMSGMDLNRQWGDNALKELTPETVKIQQYIMTLSKERKIKYMVDLHGHGKKLNSFFFCCKGSDKQKENYRFISMAMRKLEERFNIYGCTYGISREKESTIRSKLHNMGIKNSLTLQTSLYGWKDANNQIKHFNESDYHQIAKSLLESIFAIEADSSMTASTLGLSKESIATELSTMIELIEKEEKKNYENEEIMSDSDPDGDRLDLKELLGKCENKLIKKKIQQSLNLKIKPKKLKTPVSLECRDSNRNMQQTFLNSTNDGRVNTTTPSNQPSFSRNQKAMHQTTWAKQSKKKSLAAQKQREMNCSIPTNQSNLKRKERQEGYNWMRPKIRSRIKTEGDPVAEKIEKKPNIVKQGPTGKVFVESLKGIDLRRKNLIKKQAKVTEEELINSQKNEEPQFDLRKSELQLRFKQLKEESLNILLTDTLSILKIIPNEKEKNNQIIRSIKNVSLRPRQFLNSQSNRRIKTQTTEEPQYSETIEPDSRFKKFKHFSNKGMLPKKPSKQTNSVFYYFPVL